MAVEDDPGAARAIASARNRLRRRGSQSGEPDNGVGVGDDAERSRPTGDVRGSMTTLRLLEPRYWNNTPSSVRVDRWPPRRPASQCAALRTFQLDHLRAGIGEEPATEFTGARTVSSTTRSPLSAGVVTAVSPSGAHGSPTTRRPGWRDDLHGMIFCSRRREISSPPQPISDRIASVC